MKKPRLYIIAFSTFCVFVIQPGLAQESSDLAKAAQNPIASLISVPFQNNTNFKTGPEERTQNILNVQPVIPFTISGDWKLITRTIVPIVSQPVPDPEDNRVTGIGDTTFTAFITNTGSSAWTWGVGPVALLPTASDDALGNDEWGLGPSLVVLTTPGPWVVGSLFSQLWSVGHDDGDEFTESSKISLFTWQYFINYNFPSGIYFTSAPIITANWESDSSERWTVPIGGGFGKLFTFGKQPVNTSIQAYYNIEKPDFGPDWTLRLQAQLLFPK